MIARPRTVPITVPARPWLSCEGLLELRDAGVLTDEEFQARSNSLLDRQEQDGLGARARFRVIAHLFRSQRDAPNGRISSVSGAAQRAIAWPSLSGRASPDSPVPACPDPMRRCSLRQGRAIAADGRPAVSVGRPLRLSGSRLRSDRLLAECDRERVICPGFCGACVPKPGGFRPLALGRWLTAGCALGPTAPPYRARCEARDRTSARIVLGRWAWLGHSCKLRAHEWEIRIGTRRCWARNARSPSTSTSRSGASASSPTA
jgi:hypothetical protein